MVTFIRSVVLLGGLTGLSYFLGSTWFALMATSTLTIIGVKLLSRRYLFQIPVKQPQSFMEANGQRLRLVSGRRMRLALVCLIGICLTAGVLSYSPRGGWRSESFLRLVLPLLGFMVLWAGSLQSKGLTLLAVSLLFLEFSYIVDIWINNQSFLENWSLVSLLRAADFVLIPCFASLSVVGLILFSKERDTGKTGSGRASSLSLRAIRLRILSLAVIIWLSFFGAAYTASLRTMTVCEWESRVLFDMAAKALRSLDAQATKEGVTTGFSVVTRRVDFYLVVEPRDSGVRLSVYSTSWFGMRKRSSTLKLDNVRVESRLKTPILRRGLNHQVDFVADSSSYLEQGGERLVIHLRLSL